MVSRGGIPREVAVNLVNRAGGRMGRGHGKAADSVSWCISKRPASVVLTDKARLVQRLINERQHILKRHIAFNSMSW